MESLEFESSFYKLSSLKVNRRRENERNMAKLGCLLRTQVEYIKNLRESKNSREYRKYLVRNIIITLKKVKVKVF